MTVLVTTHYMAEADEFCDRIALMHKGKLTDMGTPAELRAALGPEATLDDVFRASTGGDLDGDAAKGLREIRATRRTARRLG
jgi:ABC-2 type transport system ATP-binding protein